MISRQTVETDLAPQAIGPYSQGVIANGFLFCAGQTPLDPATMQIVDGGIAEQTRRALENVKAILEDAGTSLANVVKTTVFLKNMSDFAAMNEVYATYFPSSPPARSTVGNLDLPRGALVEIEAIAVVA